MERLTIGAMYREEAERFVRATMRDERALQQLFTSSFSFVNDQIARVYGLPDEVSTGLRAREPGSYTPL